MHRRTLLGATAATLAAACLPRVASPGRPSPRPPLAANPGLGVWPEPVARASTYVRETYAFAVANEDALRWIPCYCGCGTDGHRDNFDCYVATVDSGGWLVLDRHGLT